MTEELVAVLGVAGALSTGLTDRYALGRSLSHRRKTGRTPVLMRCSGGVVAELGTLGTWAAQQDVHIWPIFVNLRVLWSWRFP